ncbi:MAG: DUF2188 domain-containing protein [Pseudomonadales bacterium]
MTHKGNFHVIPHGTGWDVKREGALRALFHYETQEDAIKAGSALAQREKVELLVHGSDGQIRFNTAN